MSEIDDEDTGEMDKDIQNMHKTEGFKNQNSLQASTNSCTVQLS